MKIRQCFLFESMNFKFSDMYYINCITQEFMDYLNRYLNGIIIFKDEIKKISISYWLSEAYSNHACRFSIDKNSLTMKSFLKKIGQK